MTAYSNRLLTLEEQEERNRRQRKCIQQILTEITGRVSQIISPVVERTFREYDPRISNWNICVNATGITIEYRAYPMSDFISDAFLGPRFEIGSELIFIARKGFDQALEQIKKDFPELTERMLDSHLTDPSITPQAMVVDLTLYGFNTGALP